MNRCAVVMVVGVLFVTSDAQSFCDTYKDNGVSCFNQPADCSDVNDCVMTMVVEVPDNDTMSFTLTGKSDGWIAVGISGDRIMVVCKDKDKGFCSDVTFPYGNASLDGKQNNVVMYLRTAPYSTGADDVMMCLQNGGQVDLLDRFNVRNAKRNRASISNILGTHLNLTEGSFSNGIISCTFRRSKEVDSSVAQETFSLKNTSRYMLIGRGPVNGGDPLQHIRNPWISNTAVNLDRGDQIETDSSDTPSMRVTDKTPTRKPKMTTAAANSVICPSRLLLAVTLTLAFFRFL